MADEEAHVDGAIKTIEEKVGINFRTQLAAIDAALQSRISFTSARPQKTIPEGGDHFFIALACGEDGGNDAALAAAKNLY